MTATYDAPAKINLWLRVFPPDDSGYHPLDTLFCALELSDRLSVTTASELQLVVQGADVGPLEQNLVWRAAREYGALLGQEPRARFELHKRIPAGAGLGGGSSDAAAALRALQALHQNAVPQADLLALAARIGSDVPFFLCGSSLARAGGRGELLEPLPPLPERAVLIVQPDFAIATRAAYQWLDDEQAWAAPASALPVPGSWQDVRTHAGNSFEAVMFARYPELSRVRDLLHASGAEPALLSGSGSALFALFHDAAAARAAQQALAWPRGWQTQLTKTRTDWTATGILH
jgi:4-diphosphocytidyl-2-C-methyl-D-erythritol kinase